MLAIVFLGVVIVTVYGVIPTKDVAKKVGHFYVTTTETGLSLYQPGKYSYYLASVYNDYSIDKNANRYAIVPFETIQKNPPRVLGNNSYAEELMARIGNYFGFNNVEVKLASGSTLLYQAKVTQNTVRLVHTIYGNDGVSNATILGTTLSYSRDDFVFDDIGNLFTENSDSDIALFNQTYGVKLKKIDSRNRRPKTASKTIYIVNPTVAGAFKITADPNQTVAINRDYRLLEAEEPNQFQGDLAVRAGITVTILDHFDSKRV
jgi:hypothetical protein